jgi:AraC-like DNA-binding protein
MYLDMELPTEYMDYLMGIEAAAKLNLGMFHADRSADFRVYGLGIRERMRPGIVDRPAGTRDYLFMHFHSRVMLVADEGPCWHPRNSFVLWEPGAPHYYGNADRRWSHSWLHCDGASVEAAAGSAEIPLNSPIQLPDAALTERTLNALHDELSRHRRPDRAITEGLVQIWIRRLRRFVDPGEDASIPARILAAQAYLDRNSSEAITLEVLASFAGLSASHLSAEFRKHLGTPPMRYLLESRLTRAAYLLADVNMSISEVAREVGFRDPLYFSRRFRKRFGLSPRPYRRQLG